MLTVHQLTKKYARLIANKNLTFTAPAGQVTLLVGPNGAGKSTLIKCIIGLLRFEGTIELDGYPNRSTEAKRKFGYIPEMPAMYDMLTVEEHLEFIARAYQLKDYHDWGEQLLSRFELQEHRQKLGQELSKGMQQKLSICCALLPRPTFVLFDEPLIGLDPHAIKQVKSLIAELREQGIGLLISTHMLDSVEEVWDQALIMVKGEIAAVYQRSTSTETGESLEEAFFRITEGDTGTVSIDSAVVAGDPAQRAGGK